MQRVGGAAPAESRRSSNRFPGDELREVERDLVFRTAGSKTLRTPVEDGALDLEFVHEMENPMVSTMEISAIE